MKIAIVDLETYWAVGHSLTKMSPIAYCMHPDTEIISCAFKFGDEPTVVAFGEQQVRDVCDSVEGHAQNSASPWDERPVHRRSLKTTEGCGQCKGG